MNIIKIRSFHALRLTFCTSLCLGLGACVGGGGDMTTGDTESTSGGSTAGSSTSDGSTSGSTGDSESSGSTGTSVSASASAGDTDNTSTTGGISTTGDTSTTGPTSTGGTTGGGMLPASCEQACMAEIACLPDEYESLEICVEDCLDEVNPDLPECVSALFDLNECLAGTSCSEYEADDYCWMEYEMQESDCAIEDPLFDRHGSVRMDEE